ncbi:CBASS cGAMP-activated phospholipase [Hyphomicrobium sp. MC8b]|uniref:CBASS cGAMP-activated phospholipase n=1 Tax=Hyphomicrobium sp. MC8b TaxID=300273 RepID=UPI00391D09A8
MQTGELKPGGPRSAGSIPQRRIPQPWPSTRRFRILSLDGGGIRGIFPATILAELERRFGQGYRLAQYFDLIAGTSTGGILALGLGAGLSADDLRRLYVEKGSEIFPARDQSLAGRIRSLGRSTRHWFAYLYDREALESLLSARLGEKLFGDSQSRLCIPAFDGKHSEVFVYKTPHHRDYKYDRFERMVVVGLATSAAPTYFQPFRHGGYQLVDGGVWANNPIMLAVIEVLTCFTVTTEQIDVLSISCGEDPYIVSTRHIFGGKLAWADSIFAAMRLQSLAATNQARLLLGPPAVTRLQPRQYQPPIPLDDFSRAIFELPKDAIEVVDSHADAVRAKFFGEIANPYVPVPLEA